MVHRLESGVIDHFVVVQIEQLVKLEDLLPINELEQTDDVAVAADRILVTKASFQTYFLHPCLSLALQTTHLHFEDCAERTTVSQNFSVG